MTPSPYAAQRMVAEEIKKLFELNQSEKEGANIAELSKVALWMSKPIHIKALKNLKLQSFASSENAWMGFSFSREECEIMLRVFETAFGMSVEIAYRGSDGMKTKMFSSDDRKSVEIFRDYLYNRIKVWTI